MTNALGRGAERPPRPPAVSRLEVVRRSWLAAFWDARVAVRAGLALDDFLRARLARYVAAVPVPLDRLPLAIGLDDGQIVARPPPPPPPPPAEPAADGLPWLAPLLATEGTAIRQEVAELEIRLATLDGELDGARHRGEELSRRFAADVATGFVVDEPRVEATPEQLGRPPSRGSSLPVACAALVAAAFLATAWQAALPLLRAAGLDPAALGAASDQRLAEVVFVALFALGLAAGLFALADAALSAALRLFHGEDDPRRRRLLGGAVAASAALSVLAGAALAAVRAPGGMPGWAFVLLLLVLPAGSALVVRLSRRDGERRAAEAAAVLAWDRERARALAERARRLEELRWAADELRELERQRDAARRRLREIEARAAEAGRLREAALRQERAELSRVARSLVEALDLDRSEFIRQASARGLGELVAPRRRKGAVPEPRPVFDGATPVETERLAS